jgi:alanine dehydrogenase
MTPAAPETLILARTDIAALMTPHDWLAAVEHGFRALAAGEALSPAPLHIPLVDGGLHGKGASLGGPRPLVAVKINANVPGNPALRGLPTIQGAVLLIDAVDGRLLAILDSIEVTLRRTAAATALAARHLARHES